MSRKTRLVILSDTHNNYPDQVPQGDVLIHCGDFTRNGTKEEFSSFCDWFERQPHEYKICILGNHDLREEEFSTVKEKTERLNQISIVLENSSVVVHGIKFWGSSYIKPRKFDFKESSQGFRSYLKEIPTDVDILITHGPPKGYGDRLFFKHWGCPQLLGKVEEIKPKYHFFGHIHQAYGEYQNKDTCFINAAMCDLFFNLVHPPVVIDF